MQKIIATFILSLMLIPGKADQTVSEIPLADPYILLEDGIYYAYGTNAANGIQVWFSRNLKEWAYKGLALNKVNTTETQWFWAPEVYHKNDKYYMYYSANEHLYVATADSPFGPFKQVGSYQMETMLGDEKCIDSHVFFDDDGTAYIFFVRFNNGNCIWKVQLEEDLITPIPSTLRQCIIATEGWEIILGKVAEGPNVIKYNGKYYLTYSANDYQSQDYAVGYATATSMSSRAWSKYSGNPIVKRVENLVGTGHHSLFTDKEGKLRIVFHAHNSTTAIHPRMMYIGTMEFVDNVLTLTDEPIIRPVMVDASGIEQTTAKDAVEVERYNALGQRIEKKEKGLNIVKMSDNSVVKTIVR